MTRELKFLCAMLTLAVLVLVILIARLDDRTAKKGKSLPDTIIVEPPLKVGDKARTLKENWIEVTPTPAPSPVEARFFPAPIPYTTLKWLNAIPYSEPPKEIGLNGEANGTWLWVLRLGDHKGYDPCFTSIESVYRPVVKQLPGKKWEVIFETQDLTSEFPDP